MKKLPKRDGYKPKPLPRIPTLEEIYRELFIRQLKHIAAERGFDVEAFFRRRFKRKGLIENRVSRR